MFSEPLVWVSRSNSSNSPFIALIIHTITLVVAFSYNIGTTWFLCPQVDNRKRIHFRICRNKLCQVIFIIDIYNLLTQEIVNPLNVFSISNWISLAHFKSTICLRILLFIVDAWNLNALVSFKIMSFTTATNSIYEHFVISILPWTYGDISVDIVYQP